MNNMAEAIHTVKSTLTREEWQRRISDCQSSGMSVKAWCAANNVPPQESAIPGEIRVTLPADAFAEPFDHSTMIFAVLPSCSLST